MLHVEVLPPMQSTRWEILQLLKRRGRATVDELAKALGMTLMGVRLHLVVVERDGYVRRGTLRRKPGRPALVYSLTPAAEEVFPKRYDQLAETLLEALGDQTATGEKPTVLETAAHAMAAPLARRVEGGTVEQRVESAVRVLDEIGAFAALERVDGGYLIHQRNCLFYRVAQRNREVCSIDRVVLKEMLGVDVEQRASILEGAEQCSHFVSERIVNRKWGFGSRE